MAAENALSGDDGIANELQVKLERASRPTF
jgi:hypothetical protein